MLRIFAAVLAMILIFPAVSGCAPGRGRMTNLKNLSVEAGEAETAVILGFVDGSFKAGYEEYPQRDVPDCRISLTRQPVRLMIQFSGLSFWDWKYDSDVGIAGLVLGAFGEASGDGEYVLYIQLSGNAEYEAARTQGGMRISLKPKPGGEGEKYYCLSDSFGARRSGEWPRSVEMYPVLCSDLENKLLISEPFDTEEQARSFMERANTELKTALPKAALYIDRLGENALPDYLYEPGADAEKREILSVSGAVRDTPALLRNGRYLCSSRDGRVLFARNSRMVFPDGGVYDTETLWMLYSDGSARRLSVQNFGSLRQAGFSPDGRFAAVLDDSASGELYVYDTVGEKTYGMADEGFGTGVQSFCWSDMSDEIYAVAGEEETRLLCCEFTPDGASGVRVLRDLTYPDGEVWVSRGRVFFMEGDFDTGEIYEYGVPDRDITGGTGFAVSGDGALMLVFETSPDEGGLTSLKLCDIQTGICRYVAKDVYPESYCFSADGARAFYTAYIGKDEKFPYGLYSYDISAGTVRLEALSAAGIIYGGISPGEIYLVYGPDDEKGIYSKYTYDFQ